MAKIIEKSENLDARQLFNMTTGDDLTKISECNGRQFDIEAYVIYTDINGRSGEEQEILTFATSDRDIICTNSATVIRKFRTMLECFTLPITDVIVKSGTSKGGRTYYDLGLK